MARRDGALRGAGGKTWDEKGGGNDAPGSGERMGFKCSDGEESRGDCFFPRQGCNEEARRTQDGVYQWKAGVDGAQWTSALAWVYEGDGCCSDSW